MCLIDWLVLAHLVGDYLIQTEYEAMNKALGRFWNRALVSHCLKYTAVFAPLFHLMSVSQWWLGLIFASHMFLDRRWFVVWWRKTLNRNSDEAIKNTFWLTIVVDQIFHFAVLVAIAHLG